MECLLAALSDAAELGLGPAAEQVAAALVSRWQQEEVAASPLWSWLPRPVQASLEGAWRQQQRSSTGVLAAVAEAAAGEGQGSAEEECTGSVVHVAVHVLASCGAGAQVLSLQRAWGHMLVL